jgi:hypothetical protein
MAIMVVVESERCANMTNCERMNEMAFVVTCEINDVMMTGASIFGTGLSDICGEGNLFVGIHSFVVLHGKDRRQFKSLCLMDG